MPIIYLSPSTQDWNPYVTGSGSEEYHMNQVADEMVPYLLSSGIRYTRNSPNLTAGAAIRQANSGYYDLYLALHSNASGEGNYGGTRGIIAFYYPGSGEGERAADIFADNLRDIYPLPNQVTTRATTSLGEVKLSRFPAVLLEIGYHDNRADAQWVENNTAAIARNLVLSLTQFFDIPFIRPQEVRYGTVSVSYGTLNLRSRPSPDGTVIANIPSGATVSVYGEWQGWYVVHYGVFVGYAASRYISLK